MRIKVGDKLPSSELFYIDNNKDVKKIDILDLCKNNRTIILGMPEHLPKHVLLYIFLVI